MDQDRASSQAATQKATTTERMAGVSAEKLDLKYADEAVPKWTTSESQRSDAGKPKDGKEQRVAETRTVEAKDRKKLIDEGFSQPEMLQRRVVTNETVWPWSTIGKFFVGATTDYNRAVWEGSGVLVGRNLVLTAGHVIPWDIPNWWMRFVPAFNNGSEPFGASYVESYRGYKRPGDVSALDYAVCKLFTPLGDSLSWMGAQSFGDDDAYYNGSWTSVGYPNEPTNPGARLMIVEDNVKIIDVDNEGSTGRELESDLYGLPGWSGGPLWAYIDNQPLVVGVMSGDETDFLQPRHTVSAGGSALVELVKWGRSNWTV